MRLRRLLVPLALLTPLALASPAAALDWSVTAKTTFEFAPAEPRIAVGDSVTWSFEDAGHTTTAVRGQPERWDSAPDGTNRAGDTFTHTFDVPGRYQYVCTPHKTFMKGVVVVGTDAVADSIDDLRAKRTGNRVKVSFQLNEPATVTYRLKGPSGRTVRLGRLAAGDRGFTVRRLKRGTYRGVLSVVDDFDKKVTPRTSFVVR